MVNSTTVQSSEIGWGRGIRTPIHGDYDPRIDTAESSATIPGELWKGIKSGWFGANKAVGSVLEYAGELTGLEPVKQIGKETSDYWGDKADANAAAVSRIEDIDSGGDFAKWAAWNVGQMGSQIGVTAPFMAMGGAAKGGVTGYQAVKALVTRAPGASGTFGKFLGSWAKLKPMDIPIGILESGQIAEGQLKALHKGEIDELHPIRGLAAAFTATKLEELGAENVVNRLMRGAGGQSGKFIKRVVKSAAGTGVGEGTEEFFQTYAENFGIDPTDIGSKEKFMEAVNGAAAGFIGGFGVGVPVGALSRNTDDETGASTIKAQATGTSLSGTQNNSTSAATEQKGPFKDRGYNVLSPEYFNDFKSALETGADKEGLPFSVENAQGILDAYKKQPGADPASIGTLQGIIDNHSGTKLLKQFNERIDTGFYPNDKAALHDRDTIIKTFPHLTDDANRAFIRYTGNKINKPFPEILEDKRQADLKAQDEMNTYEQIIDEIDGIPAFVPPEDQITPGPTLAQPEIVESDANKEDVISHVNSDSYGIVPVSNESGPGAPSPVTAERPDSEPSQPVSEIAARNTALSPGDAEEKAAITLKQQKKYLLEKVDEAIEGAPDVRASRFGEKQSKYWSQEQVAAWKKERAAAYTEDKEKYGTVTIEIPNDGTFTILNTKQSLTEFKKRAAAFPSAVVPASKDKSLPQTPSNKPTGKRIRQEGVEYYNKFKPRDQDIIEGETGNNGIRNNIYADGWFTDGHYAVKTAKPSFKTWRNTVPDLKRLIPNNIDLEPATILGEFSKENFPEVYAHITSESRGDMVVPAEQVDAILTKYPDAKPYSTKNYHGAIVFKSQEEAVGLAMPLREYDLSEFAERIKEVKTERSAEETEGKKRESKPLPSFVMAPDGSIDFGEITNEVAKESEGKYPKGPIRLEEGEERSYGRKHISTERIAEFKDAGYEDEIDILYDVTQNYTDVYEQPNGRLLLIKRNGRKKYAAVELQKVENGYYGVTTWFLEPKEGEKKPYETRSGRKLLLHVARATGSGRPVPFATADKSGQDSGDWHSDQSSPNRVNKIAHPYPEVNTEDSGAELTYNKRNRIKTGIKWEDIADKNTALRVKETTKQNVYPRPDYRKMVDDGTPVLIAHIVKQAYDSISTFPVLRGDPAETDLQLYIAAVNRVMDGVMAWSQDSKAIAGWADKQAKMAGAALGRGPISIHSAIDSGKSPLDTVYPNGWREYMAEVKIIGGNKLLKALQPGFSEAKKAVKEIRAGWPEKQEAWQRQGWKVVASKEAAKINDDYYRYDKNGKKQSAYIVEVAGIRHGESFEIREEAEAALSKLKPYLLLSKSGTVKKQFDTKEAAEDFIRERTKKESGGATVNDKGISVESAERSGLPEHRLEGENIASDQLKDTFGFKGVNFGNWMKGDANTSERQLHLNHAYDSFLDLAEILNVPPRAMSLNGMLGLAIGAQGSGVHAAHFVPGVNEINLTRTYGAGSLAHEFGHALDHYFARQAGLEASKEPFLTEHVGGSRKFSDGIRPEMVDSFNTVVEKMNVKTITLSPNELETKRKDAIETAKKRVTGWLRAIRSDYERQQGVDLEAFDKLADRIVSFDLGEGKISAGGKTYLSPVVADMRDLYKKASGRTYSIDQVKGLQGNVDHYTYLNSKERAQEDHIPQIREVSTNYTKNAVKLDRQKGGKPYWSTNLEKFARAFDTFVSDTLEQKAASNTYLSHSERAGETVPMGKERKAINEAFQKLVDEIKTRETDTGVAMFSRGIDLSRLGRPLTQEELEWYAKQLMGKGKNQPHLVVVKKVDELPFDAPDDSKGAYHDGAMYLVSEQITLPEDANEVILHEFVGHFGLRGFFGSALNDALLDIHENNPLVQKHAAEWKDANKDFQKQSGMNDTEYYYRSIEEAMAKMAQEGKPYDCAKRLAATLQSLLREIGLNRIANKLEAKTNAEALTMLHKANLYIKKGFSQSTSRIPEPLYPFFMTAWHGSPHTFDKFSTEKIGTGEGAQAYGYGLYFAGLKEVGEYYRRSVAAQRTKDSDHAKKLRARAPEVYDLIEKALAKDDFFGTGPLAVGHVVSNLMTGKPSMKVANLLGSDFERVYEAVGSLPLEGHLYKVELAPAEDEYLLWNKSLSEQSEKVKAILEKANPELSHGRYSDYANESGVGDVPNGGKALYEMIAQRLGERRESRRGYNVSDDKSASEYLHSLGIRGVKYLDGTSRGKGEGSYNYVIFSEDDVEITEQYSVKSDREAKADQDFADEIRGWESLKRNEAVTLNYTPTVLQMLGAEDLPMEIDKDAIRKILYSSEKPGGKHGQITIEQLADLPTFLKDPIMVFASKGHNDSLVVMTEMLDSDGDTVIAAIHLSKEKKRHIVNDIASVYGKDKAGTLTSWINDGLLRYMNKKKSHAWSVTSGLYLPTVRGSIPGFRNKILFEHDLVKWRNQEQLSIKHDGIGGVTEDDIRALFPGQGVEKVGSLYVVTPRGGGFFLIENVERIERDNGKAMIGYGRKMKESEVIAGSYLKGEIKIAQKGDRWTLAHESVHYLEDAGLLNSSDIATLRGHIKRLVAEKKFRTNNRNDIGGAEDRADFIANAIHTRPRIVGLAGRVIDRILKFVDALGALIEKRTVSAIVRDVKSGRIYNKPAMRKLGAPIQEAITKTEAFRKWFGNSRVVDEDGEPLVVYHTGAFDDSKIISASDVQKEKGNYDPDRFNHGIYFTADAEYSGTYGESLSGKPLEGASMFPVYLSIQNPLIIDNNEDLKGIGVRGFDKDIASLFITHDTMIELKSKGYDGIINKVWDEIVAFDPTQIKSAIGNQGTYDSSNPDIRYSVIKKTIEKIVGNGEPYKKVKPSTEEPARDMPASKLRSLIKDETDAILQTALSKLPKNVAHMSMLEKIFKSPEYYSHPVLGRIVRLFMRDRNEIYHEYMNYLMSLDNPDLAENTLSEITTQLKGKGLSVAEILCGKTSQDYKDLQRIIDEGDTSWVRDPDQSLEEQIAEFEKYIQGWASPDAIRVWKHHRESYDRALELMTAQMRQMMGQIEENAAFMAQSPDYREMYETLKGAMASMETWKGFYAPRLRQGNWVVYATRGKGDEREAYREHRFSEWSANRLAARLEREGWSVRPVREIQRLSEDVYEDLKTANVAKAIEAAIGNLSRRSIIEGNVVASSIKLNEELLQEVADMIRARGYRSHMIHRKAGANVVRGYIEDPMERNLLYLNNVARGMAKSKVAQQAIKELMGYEMDGRRFGGISPDREPRVYSAAQDYIEEQLRNLDATDRFIGWAKSLATLKFLGFSVRSAIVNMTALLSTAPVAIHQYVAGGSVSFSRINRHLAKAGIDYARFMTGKKLANPEEQAFLDEVKRLGWDDPQYTRDALGGLNKVHNRIWSTMMDGAMWLFGTTEQLNRGATVLAAYRIARNMGKGSEEAAELAKISSDKAHGVYGRATLPAVAWGRNPAAKIAQMLYVYQKFSHNYLQMLYETGFKKKNIKGAIYGIVAPIILSGVVAAPLKELWLLPVINLLATLFGAKDWDEDIEKWFWDVTRQNFGEKVEIMGRFGLAGAIGGDISGSLSIGVGIPKDMYEWGGAIGGVAKEGITAAREFGQGRYARATEHLLPSGFANVARAVRERGEGVTTERGGRVWDGQGSPLFPTAGETALRTVGLRSSRQATLSARMYEAKRQAAEFNEKKKDIYERYRAYLASTDKNPKKFRAIRLDIREFNAKIRDLRLQGEVSLITYESMRRQAKGMVRAGKKEMRMLQ